jgi:hypothetical protein
MGDMTPEEKAAAEAKAKGDNGDVAKMKADLERFSRENSDLIKELTANKKILNDKLEAEKAANEKSLAENGKYKELAEAKDKENKDMAQKVKDLQIEGALKVAAIQAGIVDIDGLKLADKSKISIDETTGAIKGVDETLKELKVAKPFLFGNGKTGGGFRPSNPDQSKLGDLDVRNMKPEDIAKLPKEERQKAIAQMTGRDPNMGKSAFTIAREAAAAKK